MYYIRQIIAQISQKTQRKTYGKFSIRYTRQIIAHISQKSRAKCIGCFALLFFWQM